MQPRSESVAAGVYHRLGCDAQKFPIDQSRGIAQIPLAAADTSPRHVRGLGVMQRMDR
jgi:hypothetical protein